MRVDTCSLHTLTRTHIRTHTHTHTYTRTHKRKFSAGAEVVVERSETKQQRVGNLSVKRYNSQRHAHSRRTCNMIDRMDAVLSRPMEISPAPFKTRLERFPKSEVASECKVRRPNRAVHWCRGASSSEFSKQSLLLSTELVIRVMCDVITL